MSVIGPLAADPDDLAAELDVLTDIPLPKPAARKHGDWRILLLPEHPVAKAQASIKRAIHGVGAAFEKAGARVDRTSDLLPDLVQQYGHYMHRSEEHTSELQSLMRISYAVFCLKKKKQQ